MNAFDLAKDIDLGRGVPVAGAVTSRSLDERFSETATDVLVGVVPLVGTALVLLLLWVIFRVPRRSGPTTTGAFRCPVLGRVVLAEFQLGPGGARRIDVIWCTAFHPAVRVRCKKRCVQATLDSASMSALDEAEEPAPAR